jgi:hypothetical protein
VSAARQGSPTHDQGRPGSRLLDRPGGRTCQCERVSGPRSEVPASAQAERSTGTGQVSTGTRIRVSRMTGPMKILAGVTSTEHCFPAGGASLSPSCREHSPGKQPVAGRLVGTSLTVISRPCQRMSMQFAERPHFGMPGRIDSSMSGEAGQCLSGLLETSSRIGVWPDSVQVSSGMALFWAAHPCVGVALFRSAVRRAP